MLEQAIKQLDKMIDKLKGLDEDINEHLDSNMESYFNEIVVPEMKIIARAINLPLKFIDGIRFIKTGKNQGKIVNTWGSAQKPLAKWFNFGVTSFPIYSKGKWPLRFTDKETGKEVHVSTKNKPVVHPGFPRTNAMEIGISEGIKRLRQESLSEENNFLKVKANE